MTILINFKEENLHLENLFDILRDFLKLETNHEIKMTSYKIVKKFKIFYKQVFSQQQTTVKEFIFLKLRSYKINMKSQICNYTYNYTAMTVTMYYYYYINNCYNSI